MKRFFYIVLAFVVTVSLAACTSDNNDTTTLPTTTTSLQTTTSAQGDSSTATTTITTTTTIRGEQSTTDVSNVVTTTTPATTTTTYKAETTYGVGFYSQHPKVPDYGSLIGVEYSWYENNVYYYRVDVVANADPQNEGASQYMQLLNDNGYIAYQPYDKDGVQGYVYVNTNYGTMVLFGAAREQGVIVVAISQQ